jgi:uncharacterized oligopeptide transporter (OPT) family protein
MSHDPNQPPDSSSPIEPPRHREKPPGFNEFTPRAIVCGLIVAALMGASYPYVVLKLGFGPNVSVVAAILGYLALGLVLAPLGRLLGRAAPYNRWENNIIETAGTAAAQTAFMCVLLAAFDLLAQRKVGSFNFSLTSWQSFAWLTSAGILGVLLAVPLRRHYIIDENLPFVDGIAAGETILVCDSKGPAAVRAALAMLVGLIVSALVMTLREDARVFTWIPEVSVFPIAFLAATGFGIAWSPLAVGSGMLLGMRINVSMLLGAVLSWVIAPYVLEHYGIIQMVTTKEGSQEFPRRAVLFWVMWPATGLMVSAGLAALVLRWKVLARTFKNLSASTAADDFPLGWVVAGSILSGAALVIVQKTMLGQPVWITLVAIVLSAPLALVGLRVLGETNWGPISALSNLMQGVFGLIAPGNVAANMVASGTTGTIASESEGLMQDYRAGQMVGTSPRKLTYMQLLAIPVGAAAVSWMYPVLREKYTIGGDKGLTSPTAQKWAGFAEILSEGIEKLPQGALTALVVASILGIALAVLEALVKNKALIPSPTALGIGMLVPGSVIVTMVIGGLIGSVWTRTSRQTSESYLTPLASGLIAGEALVAVVVPVLVICGVIKV